MIIDHAYNLENVGSCSHASGSGGAFFTDATLLDPIMEEIRGSVRKPLQELKNEMKELRTEVTRLKEQQSQELTCNTKKGRLPKILTVCCFALIILVLKIIVSC